MAKAAHNLSARRVLTRLALGSAACFAVLAATILPASASGASKGPPRGTLVADYADATWQDVAGGLDVRVAPGVEKLDRNTTRFLEASIDGTVCLPPKSRRAPAYLVTADLELVDSGRLHGVSVAARHGTARAVTRHWPPTRSFDGTLSVTPADAGCANPDYTRTKSYTDDVSVTLQTRWAKAPGAVPVEYSGSACGGTGQCYSVDAVARGTLTLPGCIRIDLGETTEAFLYEGVFPPA